MNKPNIIFIFSDQQRWDTVGCYNRDVDFTPNLDRLASEGVIFDNAITCQPVCGPARACLQTGMYATQTGCYRNNIALPDNAVTIAQRFNDSGYETAYIGKWHLASTGGKSNEDIGEHCNYKILPIPPEKRGGYRDYWLASDVLEFTSDGYGGHMFDGEGRQVDFSGFRADCQTDFVLDYLGSRNGDRPFFLFLSYIEPHHQNDAKHFQGPEGSRERFRDFPIPGDLTAFDTGDWAQEYPDYLGCCASLDENVGRITAKLKELGVYEDTLIVYTSDHGSHFRTRNGEYKRSCHDSCVHIPLIIRGPGFTGGTRRDDMVSLLDLPATLLAGAGIEVPSDMPSRPLQRLISDGSGEWRQDVLIQISESQVGRAIRTKRWKYSVSAPDKSGKLDAGAEIYREEFLYDLENDRFELNNLIADEKYAAIRNELKTALIERITESGECVPEIVGAGVV